MNQSVELRDILIILKRESRLIVTIITIMTIAGAAISYLVPPEYQAKTDLLVNYSYTQPNTKELSPTEIDTNLRLIETYKYILTSSRVLEKAALEIGKSKKPEDLTKQINVESNTDSQIISISAQDRTYDEAAKIADAIANTFQSEIKDLMKVDNVQILTQAKTKKSSTPIKPNRAIYVVLSFLLGAITSFIIVLLKELIFTKTDSAEKAERAFDLQSFGVIPVIDIKQKRMQSKINDNVHYLRTFHRIGFNSPVIESYRAIRTNLKYTMNQQKLKSILFTSTNPEEGKSLTSGNLAICMALDNIKTVYVDLDLRKGVGNSLFNIPNRKGLTNYLEGTSEIKDIISNTDVPNLSFISRGPVPPNPAELLSSEKMGELFQHLKQSFDLIIIDSPPLIVSDAVILSTKADGCVYIVNAKKTNQHLALKRISQLKKVQANVLGLVINNGKVSTAGYYY